MCVSDKMSAGKGMDINARASQTCKGSKGLALPDAPSCTTKDRLQLFLRLQHGQSPSEGFCRDRTRPGCCRGLTLLTIQKREKSFRNPSDSSVADVSPAQVTQAKGTVLT